MTPILTLLDHAPFIDWLRTIPGWAGWLLLLGALVAGVVRWGGKLSTREGRLWLLLLSLSLVPLTNLFLGLRLPSGEALSVPGLPSGPHNPLLLAFSALPWMLAGGFLGPLEAVLVGGSTGLVRSLWDTHNLFTLLEPAVLALLFSLAARQRFRTRVYRLIRQPALLAIVLVPVYAVLFIYSSLFSISGGLAARLDFALTNAGSALLAVSGELLLAGLFAQVLAVALPRRWGGQQALEPSPSERSLQTRFLIGGGTFIAALLVSLVLGDWTVAGSAARRMLRDRLGSSAQAASEGVPFFLETGQNLIASLALEPGLLGDPGPELSGLLAEQMHTRPYFDQLYVLETAGGLLASYPVDLADSFGLLPEEASGLALAVQGVSVQIYSLPPGEGETSARISYLAAVSGEQGQVQRLLLGRSLLATNPLTQPLINSLSGLATIGGEGKLLDEQGRILYSSNPNELMGVYAGRRGPQALFYEQPAPGGTRSLVYYQPVAGRSWAVVLTVPAEQAQRLALDIAAPLTVLVLVLAGLALVWLGISLRVVTSSLKTLTAEAGRIARGSLDYPLPTGGVDEVGELGRSFEQMRLSLHARLEELNQLLLVSQGVASTLEIEQAVQPVLEALLPSEASAVRVALAPESLPEGAPAGFGLGPRNAQLKGLDPSILKLVRKHNRLVVRDLSRQHSLHLSEGGLVSGSLLAVALTHESQFYGCLWAAYDQPRAFSDGDVRFLTTLAGYAALAAANAHLFRSAEVGRQRLAAILSSTPDPVLVTDEQDCLLLVNPAAQRALGAATMSIVGQPAEKAIGQKELRDLLLELGFNKKSAEVVLADGKIYFATASAVLADGRPVGRVCVLRDVTHFKELDALKSDFVSTVSHDLRSPLTLMRGYITMLDMVGRMNDQQKGYLEKILTGVESMTSLVNNLLDLGRIDAGVGLQVEDVSIKEVTHAVLGTLRLQAEQKKIRLKAELAPGLPKKVEADKALLQQGLYNLVENAIKYTPEKGRVELRVRPLSDWVQFEVADTGIGIPLADQSRLFEKFFRGSQREARAQRGSGLGLAIVRSIAEQHAGKVWVDSQSGKGSTFYLILPCKQLQGIKKEAKAV